MFRVARHVMFYFFAIFAFVIVIFLILLVLFEPGLEYKVHAPEHELGSEEFLCLLGALSDAQVHRDSRIEVLTNGDVFYEAQLEAIRSAGRSINLEAYIFRRDVIGQRFVDALAERARAGVKVNVIVDAVGSLTTWDSTFKPLRDAGGRVQWYQPLRSLHLQALQQPHPPRAAHRGWRSRLHRRGGHRR